MKQTARIISTYTGDTSGVCSALYELGGLVVMHDPSGCNSTYSTHDEPRWYDMDSLIFISGLTEKDAIFGNDEKIINATVEAARDLSPRFIAIAGTPISHMTGCDYDAIAMEIESRCKIPSFGFDTDGMHSYVKGASKAFTAYADRMCSEKQKNGNFSINILGVTPLDFSINGSVDSMRTVFENNGISVNSVFSMGSHYSQIENACAAHVNVVVSSTGLECAKLFYKKYGIPYVIGTPYGKAMTDAIISDVKNAYSNGNNILSVAMPLNGTVVIIGESITSLSLASALKYEFGINSKVISPVDTPGELKKDYCINVFDEDEIRDTIKEAECVIADPMYRPICTCKTKFIDLPHEAFSGRIYRNIIPDLIKNTKNYFINEF